MIQPITAPLVCKVYNRHVAAEIAQLQEGLGQLFQAGLQLALAVQQRAMAAETADDQAKLGTTFHRLSRSVRQTAAWKMRLLKDAEALMKAQARRAEDKAASRRKERKARVEAALTELIASEEDEETAEALELELCERLEREALFDSFLDEPIEVQVERIAKGLGLSVKDDGSFSPCGRRWPEGPDEGAHRPGRREPDAPPQLSPERDPSSVSVPLTPSPARGEGQSLETLQPEATTPAPFTPRWHGDGPWNST